MAALPTDFLKQVVAEAAALKGIKDAQGVIKENDPLMAAAASLAYVQVWQYCHRPFHYGERTEFYSGYFGPTTLRTIPIDTSKPIIVKIDGEELDKADWKIVRNQLVLYGKKEFSQTALYTDIEVTCYSGITLAENNPMLFSALKTQTVGNYHRRDTLGLAETSGEKGIARTPADSGELLESVVQMIASLVYEGIGESADGE